MDSPAQNWRLESKLFIGVASPFHQGETTMSGAKQRKLTKKQHSALQQGLASASFPGFKIKSMHLIPNVASTAAPPQAAAGACHAVQLPNGHWVIVCD
jgi:hypothetical protein